MNEFSLKNLEELKELRIKLREFIKKSGIKHDVFVVGANVFNNFEANKELICDYSPV